MKLEPMPKAIAKHFEFLNGAAPAMVEPMDDTITVTLKRSELAEFLRVLDMDYVAKTHAIIVQERLVKDQARNYNNAVVKLHNALGE